MCQQYIEVKKESVIGDIKIFEVELKARLKTGQIENIEKILENTYECQPEVCVYHDIYFDTTSKNLGGSEKELRLRKITSNKSETILLTYKEPPFDNISKSKIEHEVSVNSNEQAIVILEHLGYSADISFEKHCTNFRVVYQSLEIILTLVRMIELKRDFIEVEVQTAEANMVTQIYVCLHEFLLGLKVMPDQLTNEYYTDMVRQARNL